MTDGNTTCVCPCVCEEECVRVGVCLCVRGMRGGVSLVRFTSFLPPQTESNRKRCPNQTGASGRNGSSSDRHVMRARGKHGPPVSAVPRPSRVGRCCCCECDSCSCDRGRAGADTGETRGETEEGDSGRAEEEERGWGRKPHRTSPNSLEPGDPAPAFTVPTLDGPFQYEPGVFRGSLIIHAFTNQSAFLESVWGSEEALVPLVQGLPESAHVLLMSLDDSAMSDVLWMREQLYRAATRAFMDKSVLSRLHFYPLPVFFLGNWIPAVLYSWMCSGHNCGLPQAVFSSSGDTPKPS
ncbi:hypothetical protein WMY93_020762 [Mugilogobius chulae]|uniref:Uncharacterized protein n=1 Tax=Mugilogobius chulae TaxID=88201 RepID=A0AAW0NDP0_9GOBI